MASTSKLLTTPTAKSGNENKFEERTAPLSHKNLNHSFLFGSALIFAEHPSHQLSFFGSSLGFSFVYALLLNHRLIRFTGSHCVYNVMGCLFFLKMTRNCAFMRGYFLFCLHFYYIVSSQATASLCIYESASLGHGSRFGCSVRLADMGSSFKMWVTQNLDFGVNVGLVMLILDLFFVM